MKRIVPLLFMISCAVRVEAQITTPVIKAAFGVDGDVKCNYFNGVGYLAALNDDWFYSAGTGKFMIDTTGAGAYVAGVTANANNGLVPFYRTMRYPSYDTTLSNRTLIDAV